MRRRLCALSLCALSTLFISFPGWPARASDAFLVPPVDAGVAGGFSAPPHPWSAGHRGIDYTVPEGSSVRAAGSGVVSFAGPVAGGLAVTIDHGGGLETTYSWLSELYVSQGESVAERAWIGRSGSAHGPDVPGLHFGVKVDGDYVDPLLHLGPLDTAGAIALAPLDRGWPYEDRHVRACRTSGELPERVDAPNDNIVVAIGGITSATDGSGGEPDLFDSVKLLGYSPLSTYLFSYRGSGGPALHSPYGADDTYQDIRSAAGKLRTLMEAIARRHPGRDVDIVAHSQGGIVGRTYLARQATGWDPRLPRIEHFVTFASPHQGVPAAGEIDELKEGPLASRMLASGLDRLSELGLPVPPSDASSVLQLREGSDLLNGLDAQDVAFGTRVLALSIPNDILVPAGNAAYPEKLNRTLPASGLWGHSEIVRSERALQIAHAFLGGAGASCPPPLGFIESRLGGVVARAQGLIGDAVNALTGLAPL